MKELSAKARAMLDALQTVDSPAPDVQTQVWSAVAARTAAGDLGPAIPADTVVGQGAAGAGWLGKTLAVVIGAAAIATAIGVGTRSNDEVGSPARLVGTGVPAPRVVALEIGPEDEPEIEPEIEPVVAPPSEPAVAPTKSNRPRPRGEAAKVPTSDDAIDGPDALEREMRLMSDARAALGAGDAGRAIKLLSTHAKQFPSGAFVLEREVSWITALCALGKTDAARKRAEPFLRKHGSHALAAKVRASCGGSP
jgi:hypothetical protein